MSSELYFPFIRTPRLALRRIQPADAQALFGIYSNPDVMRWYGLDPMTEMGQVEGFMQSFEAVLQAGAGVRWGLERVSDNRLLGTCGFFRWNREWSNCMLSYELAHDCHRQGYMREALCAVLQYGFFDMRLHRVQIEMHQENAASRGLAASLGFCFEGMHRENAFWAGRFHDSHIYSLLAREWDARLS